MPAESFHKPGIAVRAGMLTSNIWVDGIITEKSKLLLDYRPKSRFTINGTHCVIQIKGSEFGDYKLYIRDTEVRLKLV